MTRAIEADDQEIENLKRGNVSAARDAFRAQRVKTEEQQALYLFFKNHLEIANCQANEHILRNEAATYGAVLTAPILELALLRVGRSLIPTPSPRREPTAEELAAEERKRLVSLDRAGLQAELAKRAYKRPVDRVSPDCLVLRTKEDIDRLSAPQLKGLLYRPSDGSRRAANHQHINNILQGNQN